MAQRRTKKDIVKVETMGDFQIPFYAIVTADNLRMVVPKYVRRIYSTRNGKVNTSGWQIAFIRKGLATCHRFFPDRNQHPSQSLDSATRELRRFLDRTPNTKQSGLRLQETKTTIHRTGVSGIRLDWRFGKRNALYDLKVEVRAGAYSPSKTAQFYVGTEFSVTEDRLRWALNEAFKFRNQRIAYAKSNGQVFPKFKKPPRLDVDVQRAYDLLQHEKKRHQGRLREISMDKASRWMDELRLYKTFRGNRFYSTRQTVQGCSLKVPDFIELKGDEWICDFDLPDGSSYYDEVPLSSDPQSDVTRLIADCFYESMVTTMPAPVDRLFSDERSPDPMHAKHLHRQLKTA